MGFVLGWASYALSPAYRRRFAANVLQAGVAPSAARPAIAEAGRMLMELPYVWLRPANQSIHPTIAWDGVWKVGCTKPNHRGASPSCAME